MLVRLDVSSLFIEFTLHIFVDRRHVFCRSDKHNYYYYLLLPSPPCENNKLWILKQHFKKDSKHSVLSKVTLGLARRFLQYFQKYRERERKWQARKTLARGVYGGLYTPVHMNGREKRNYKKNACINL